MLLLLTPIQSPVIPLSHHPRDTRFDPSDHPAIHLPIDPATHVHTPPPKKAHLAAPTANKNQPRAKPPNHPPDKGHRKADLKDTSSQETCPKKKIT